MRKRRTPPRIQRYAAKLRASGLVSTSAFIPRSLTAQITDRAKQSGYSRGIVIEAALHDALRTLTPSALQRVAQERKRRLAELAGSRLAPSEET